MANPKDLMYDVYVNGNLYGSFSQTDKKQRDKLDKETRAMRKETGAEVRLVTRPKSEKPKKKLGKE